MGGGAASRETSPFPLLDDPWGVPLMLRRLALLCVLLCAVSCSPKTPLRQKAATIDVGPNPILFQPLAVGKTAAVTVQVKNVGNIDLHLAKDPYVVELDNDGLVEYDTPAMLA